MTQVSKDAKECMQECVSEFISFITSEYPTYTNHHYVLNFAESCSGPFPFPNLHADMDLDMMLMIFSLIMFNPLFTRASDKCIAEKRKTITGDDILVAMATLGFDNYIEPLKLYLQKYREVNS